LKLFYFYILLLHYQIVYPESRYIRLTTADRLDVFKLHLNIIIRSRFGWNENHIFVAALWINLLVYRFWVKRKSWKYFLLFIKSFIPTKCTIPNGKSPLCSFVITIADTGYQNHCWFCHIIFFALLQELLLSLIVGMVPGNCLVFIKLIKYSTIIFWSV